MNDKDTTMTDAKLNEAFKRPARGERFAPARIPTHEEAEQLLSGTPPSRPHGSADGGVG